MRTTSCWNMEIVEHCEGKDYRAIGEYKEVERPRRLEFTFQMPMFSDLEDLITVEIEPTESGCEILAEFPRELLVKPNIRLA